jgi:hypothetical protein
MLSVIHPFRPSALSSGRAAAWARSGYRARFAGTVLALSLAASLGAQTIITQITTATIDADGAGTTTSPEGIVFNNAASVIVSYTAGSGLYAPAGSADAAFVRRAATTVNSPNNSLLWYQTTLAGTTALGTRESDYADAVLGNNLFHGGQNGFTNNPTTGGNIERLDFVWTAGISASADMSFAVFDRSSGTSNGDAFQIALITGWDSVNQVPTAFSDVVEQAADWGQNLVPNYNFRPFTHVGTGNDLSGTATVDAVRTGDNVSGITFDLSAFNVLPGTTIYGYALMDEDVTNNRLLLPDWNNATNFPTNSATSVDIAAVNGILFTVVPEPAAFGFYAFAALAAGFALRRRGRASE